MATYHLSELWRYPVKGLAGEKLQTASVTQTGLTLDRHWRLVDGKTGERLRSKETEPALAVIARGVDQSDKPLAELIFPDGRVLPTDHAAVDQALSDHFERPVALEETVTGSAFWYDTPVHLLTDTSLRWLKTHAPECNLDVRRFRPNFFVSTSEHQTGTPEFEWVGRSITIGDITLKGEKECERCIITTRAQPGLPRDPAILQTLIRESGQNLGLLANVSSGGRVTVGDQLTVG